MNVYNLWNRPLLQQLTTKQVQVNNMGNNTNEVLK